MERFAFFDAHILLELLQYGSKQLINISSLVTKLSKVFSVYSGYNFNNFFAFSTLQSPPSVYFSKIQILKKILRTHANDKFVIELIASLYTVNQLLFAKILFRDLVPINWFVMTNVRAQAFSRPAFCYNNHTTRTGSRREKYSRRRCPYEPRENFSHGNESWFTVSCVSLQDFVEFYICKKSPYQ